VDGTKQEAAELGFAADRDGSDVSTRWEQVIREELVPLPKSSSCRSALVRLDGRRTRRLARRDLRSITRFARVDARQAALSVVGESSTSREAA
jgi:hypothetical protein